MADHLAAARAATLLGSVLTALSSGTNYVYSAWAPQLGSRLHITHTGLNIIGLSGNVGMYSSGPFSGRLVDRRGPRPLLISAILLLFTGYTGLRAYYDAGPMNEESLPLKSLVFMSIFSYMTGVGGNLGITAAANATAKSFPERLRATTVGFVMSGFGISAFFFTTLSNTIFPGNTSQFLLCLSLGTALPIVVGLLTVRPVAHAERPEEGEGGFTLPINRAAMDSSEPLLGQSIHGGGVAESGETEISADQAKALIYMDPTDVHGKDMFLGWEFWVIFAIFSLLSGTGLTFINNVGVISQALSAKGNPEYDRVQAGKVQAAQVSIISLANFVSRIAMGLGADFAKSRFAIHRSYFLTLLSTLFIISQVVGSHVENVEHLWIPSVILGVGYGGLTTLLPTITIEWFGLPHFSENWGFVTLAPLLGMNVFGILFGRNLDAHAPVAADFANPHSETESQCLQGRECYAGAMTITTFACLIALCLSLVAAWRDRRRAREASMYQAVAPSFVAEQVDGDNM